MLNLDAGGGGEVTIGGGGHNEWVFPEAKGRVSGGN